MKTTTSTWIQAAALTTLVGMVATGCCHVHSHSAYRNIHQLTINGNAKGVRQDLSQNPGDLNLPDDLGQTPLHLAAIHCHTNVLGLLLDKGANVEARAKGGATPLHLAAQSGCSDAVTTLLAKGANVNARDDQSRTPLKRAEEWHQQAVAEILRRHGGGE